MTTGLQQDLLQGDNVADKPDLLQLIVDEEEIKEFFWAVFHYLQFGYVSQELDFSYSVTQYRSKLSLLRYTADLLRNGKYKVNKFLIVSPWGFNDHFHPMP